jgi:hypothetical protein
MNRQKLIVIGALVIGLVCGYFIGREHVKYELRSAMSEAISGIGEGMKNAFGSEATSKAEATSKKDSAGRKEKEDYIQQSMQVYGISSHYQDDFVDKNVPAVFGKIKNNGNRSIGKVEVTAYFLDNQGKTIFENSYPAVNAGTLMSVDTPLKPNYIKEFGFKSKGCPSEWSEGKVRVAITDIEFE